MIEITCAELEQLGLIHGFSGGLKLSFAKQDREFELNEWRAARDIPAVAYLNQVHGHSVVEINHSMRMSAIQCMGEADGFFSLREGAKQLALTIFTADCVPVICAAEDRVALIHAGWRGVAAQIVPKVLERFFGQEKRVVVVCGPAISREAYKVGREVIDQIGAGVVYKSTPQGGYLDLPMTIRNQALRVLGARLHYADLNICTYHDSRFFSHRRDSTSLGRNISFVLV